jgi:ATP-binding cassette subfamily B protein
MSVDEKVRARDGTATTAASGTSAQPGTLRGAAPGLRRTYRHLRPHLRGQRPLLLGGSAALLVEVIMRLLEPWPLKFVVDGVVAALGVQIAGQPGDLGTVLIIACVALAAITALRALAAYLMTLCFALAGNRLLTAVRAQAYAHLNSLSMAFHDKARTGDLVTRVTSDVGRLKGSRSRPRCR